MTVLRLEIREGKEEVFGGLSGFAIRARRSNSSYHCLDNADATMSALLYGLISARNSKAT